MEKQIIIRYIAPEVSAFEVISGSIVDGQFTPDESSRNDLAEVGALDLFDNFVETHPTLSGRNVVLSEHISAFVSELILLPSFSRLQFYPNFLVLEYVS